jgi:transcriptional regulator with XRE-family HTH domain
MNKYREDIAKRFRAARIGLQLTSEEVAQKSGICRYTYSKIENCNYDGIKFITIHKVASVLGLQLKLILRGE